MINYAKIHHTINDEIYTPDYAITPILKYLPKDKIYWECTDYGSSNITKVLKENGYNVISTNKEQFDFLIDKPDFNFDVIITNPPYSLKDEFLEKCYEYNKSFALLLPITTFEGKKRGKMFREKGIQAIIFDSRIKFYGNCSWFNTSWFCYKLLEKDLIFEELKK